MQLSIATLSAILATLAQATPVPQSAQAAQINGVQSAQVSGQGAQVQAAPQPATVAYTQPQEAGHNSGDTLDVLGHAKVLNGDGINVLGGPTKGGNTKRQHNSKDVVDALGHAELLNNNGINVLGHGAKGGDDVKGSQPASVHVEQPKPQPQPQPVYVENVQSKPQPQQQQQQQQPAANPPSIVGPSFNANQVQQTEQQSAVNA